MWHVYVERGGHAAGVERYIITAKTLPTAAMHAMIDCNRRFRKAISFEIIMVVKPDVDPEIYDYHSTISLETS